MVGMTELAKVWDELGVREVHRTDDARPFFIGAGGGMNELGIRVRAAGFSEQALEVVEQLVFVLEAEEGFGVTRVAADSSKGARSRTATLAPFSMADTAADIPAMPCPTTTTSNSRSSTAIKASRGQPRWVCRHITPWIAV